MSKKRIAIFASGTGSNAVNLIHYFKQHSGIEVACLLSNNNRAKVLASAEKLGVKTCFLPNSEVAKSEVLITLCKENKIDWVILAGYLRLIPLAFIDTFKNKIINLHPALLPKYGGKGMFGRNVHLAVLENGEIETGITIHFVNKEFDKGKIIAQFRCAIEKNDTVEDIEVKIHSLEQKHLPTVVKKVVEG